MGGFAGALRGGLAGAAEAAGAPQAAQSLEDANDRSRQEKANKIKMQVAPLSLALQGYKARFSDAADPNDPSKAAPGKEAEYNAAHDGMAAVIGKIRALISPPPKEDPHGLSLLEHELTDKLHITRHAVDEAKKAQKGKVAAYNQQTTDATNATVQGTVPYEKTGEGRKLELQERLRKEAQATKFSNYLLPDGKTIVPIDENHQTPPEGSHKVGNSVSASQARSLGQGIGVGDAVKAMQTAGQRFMKDDGITPWTTEELQKFPVNMKLSPLSLSGKLVYVPSDQNSSRFVVGNKVYLKDQFGDINLENPLGDARTGNTSVDAFGVKTSTTPDSPGATGSAPFPPSAPAVTSPSTPTPKANGLKTHVDQVRARTSSSQSANLDENGHIPTSAGNPNLVAAANELLDGKSQKDLQVPQKDKQAAAELARRYGYLGEGMWTPRERMQVDQSQQLIDTMRNDKEIMSVFDEGSFKRALIQSAIEKSKENGIKANFERALLNKGLSPKDVKFVQSYQNLIGRIQGLAMLTRGSGRTTEAAVNRMMQELPNILTAQSAKGAQHAFDLIQNELDIGMGKGKRSTSGGWKPPADAPPAPKEDDHKLKDGDKVIAVSRGGQWVQP
jgi:hypothetical protein